MCNQTAFDILIEMINLLPKLSKFSFSRFISKLLQLYKMTYSIWEL